MQIRFLTAMLASVVLSPGIDTAIAQTTSTPADNQEFSNPIRAPGKRTDPSSTATDRTANTPMADSEATPTAGGNDTSKPMHKKHHNHKKSGSTVLGGTNSAGGMSYSDVQAGGSDTATTAGNSYPGSSKQGQ